MTLPLSVLHLAHRCLLRACLTSPLLACLTRCVGLALEWNCRRRWSCWPCQSIRPQLLLHLFATSNKLGFVCSALFHFSLELGDTAGTPVRFLTSARQLGLVLCDLLISRLSL